ncbi:MAG TPA: DNA recombination protein RmuC [Candidatus Tripitaka sp. YC43]
MLYLIIVVIMLVVGLFIYLIITQRRGQKGQDTLLMQQQVNDLREQTTESMSQLSNMILRTNEALGSTLTQVQGQLQQRMDNLKQQSSTDFHQLTEQLSQRLQAQQEVLSKTHETLGGRLDHHANIVKDVHGKLEGLFQATQGVMELKRDIISLQEVFRAPQYRGGVGEMLLEKLLKDALPPDLWASQHPFRDGTKVDAVIKLDGKLVPIDAKFPLDNFKKLINAKDDAERKGARRAFLSDVKGKIDDISKKYIRPDEGTYDYAFMYIPAEGVYGEILALDDSSGETLLNYAWTKKVFPVSPNTFWAHLQAIHFGLKALKIEERAEEVIENIQTLKKNFENFKKDFDTLGDHIRKASGKHDEARKDLDRFGDRLEKIESLGSDTTVDKDIGATRRAALTEPAVSITPQLPK